MKDRTETRYETSKKEKGGRKEERARKDGGANKPQICTCTTGSLLGGGTFRIILCQDAVKLSWHDVLWPSFHEPPCPFPFLQHSAFLLDLRLIVAHPVERILVDIADIERHF